MSDAAALCCTSGMRPPQLLPALPPGLAPGPPPWEKVAGLLEGQHRSIWLLADAMLSSLKATAIASYIFLLAICVCRMSTPARTTPTVCHPVGHGCVFAVPCCSCRQHGFQELELIAARKHPTDILPCGTRE